MKFDKDQKVKLIALKRYLSKIWNRKVNQEEVIKYIIDRFPDELEWEDDNNSYEKSQINN